MTSESWAGFTDDDIKRIKSNPEVSKSCNVKICEIDGLSSKNRGPMKIKNMPLKYSNECLDHCEIKMKIPSAIKSSSLQQNSDDFSFNKSTESKEDCNFNDHIYQENSDVQLSGKISSEDLSNFNNDTKCDESVQSNSILPPLEIFEMRQKRIEAENARRRALINKAINDKKMRTHVEAMKLAKITQELNQIDSDLSADVSILRNYIEKASQEFSEAEKRYLKAEKEFVEAKLFLFEKMQRKEMLTEHLCAIIEQNENRKADKLVELMKQLEMEAIVEEYDVNEMQPILPNLCMLNDETYHNCQTLKPSLSKHNSKEHVPESDEKTDSKEKNLQESQVTGTSNVLCIGTNQSVGENEDTKA